MRSRFEGTVRADVVAISKSASASPVVLAVEVKSHQNSKPTEFKNSLFQASPYVNGTMEDKKLGAYDGLMVDAAFVFPAPKFKWPGRISETDGAEIVLTGIAFFAERLNVGCLVEQTNGWEIVFGPNDLWSKKKGWMGHAKKRLPRHRVVTSLDMERQLPDKV